MNQLRQEDNLGVYLDTPCVIENKNLYFYNLYRLLLYGSIS